MSNNAPDYENNLYFAPADEERDVKRFTFLFKPGFIAMDKNGKWNWYNKEPKLIDNCWLSQSGKGSNVINLDCFNFKTYEDWKESFVEVK